MAGRNRAILGQPYLCDGDDDVRAAAASAAGRLAPRGEEAGGRVGRSWGMSNPIELG